jgi:hypothetical protein
MKLFAGFGLLFAAASLAEVAPSNSTQVGEPEHDIVNSGAFPILAIGEAYIRGQSKPVSNASMGGISDVSVDGPVQCGPGKECLDKSCCNSDGKCGFMEYHCKGNATVSCISHCDAKAMCGVDSKDGNKKCG